jgi:hypothetical protein
VNTQIEFQDYQPTDLGAIFQSLCDQNQYQLPSDARVRLLLGFHQLFEQRDRHFGNGRLVRNAFEDSVRRLADRIASETQLTESLLTCLTAADISIPGLTGGQLDRLVSRPHVLRISCDGCRRTVRIDQQSLGRRVKCGKCQHVQQVEWANVGE